MHKRSIRQKYRNQRAIASAVESMEPRTLFSTYVVDTIQDGVNLGGGLLSLRSAISDANLHAGPDSITFSPAVFPSGSLTTIILNSPLTLTDTSGATTITGPGSSVLRLSGQDEFRVFSVSSKTSAAISGMEISHGEVQTNPGVIAEGGAILNYGTLTIVNDTIDDAYAQGGNAPTAQSGGSLTGTQAEGGAIYSSGSLTVVDSTISTDGVSGGGINSYDGATGGSGRGGAIFSIGTLNISGSVLADDSALGGSSTSYEQGSGGAAEGGSIYSAGTLTITSSEVSGSYVAGGGGAQLGFSAAGNGGSSLGGGIYSTGPATISGCTFDDNSAIGGNAGNSSPAGPGLASGGAVFSTSTTTVSSSTFNGCTVEGGAGPDDDNGAGGAAQGGAVTDSATLKISTSTFTSNEAAAGPGGGYSLDASGYGGAIYATGSLTLSTSTVSGNTAVGYGDSQAYGADGGSSYGGGIFTSGTATVSSCAIFSNQAEAGDGDGVGQDGGTVVGNGGNGLGGGVYSTAALTITDSTIAQNTALAGTGASSDYNGGNGGRALGGGVDSISTLNIFDSTISGNSSKGAAGGTAGAGYTAGVAGTGQGGGIAVAAGKAMLKNSIFSTNKVGSTESDILGTVSSASAFNLIGSGGGLTNGVNGNKVGVNNPMLSSLGQYGGPTESQIPLTGSPVINAGSNSLIPSGVTTDQRGYPRISATTVDIGATEFGNATITGTVFNDKNANGKIDTGESGLSGWTVFIDLNKDGHYDAGDPTATTNSSGGYLFANLPAGTYLLGINNKANYRQTSPNGYGSLGSVTVTPAGKSTGPAFGQTQQALISGTIFNDSNDNGKQDSGETGLSGFRVYIDSNLDGKWESTEPSIVTTSTGTFSFNIATPGTYRIRVVARSGYTLTTPSLGYFSLTVGDGSIRSNNLFGEHA